MDNKKKNPALEKAIKLQRTENAFENGPLINTANEVYSNAKLEEVLNSDKCGNGAKKGSNGSVKVDHEKNLDRQKRMKMAEEIRKRELKKLNVKKDRLSGDKKKPTKKNDTKKMKNGWVIATCALAITTATFGGAFAYNLIMPTTTDRSLENLYDKSFYSAIDRINNADLNMDKFLVTNDNSASVKYLLDVSVDAEIAEENFAQLPLKNEDKIYSTKLINQVGDYSKYLAKKLVDGGHLSNEEMQNAKRLSKQLKELKNSLNDINSNQGKGRGFIEINKNGSLVNGLKELENQSIEYPSLIYDGPFSEGLDSAKMKGLQGKEITKDDAKGKVEKIFVKHGAKNVEYDGEITGRVSAYAFNFDTEFGKSYAQISKVNGNLLTFTCDLYDVDLKMRSNKSKDSEDISSAEKFLLDLGVDNMKAVWTAKTHGISVINFVNSKDGVIIYPDMIKVKVYNGAVVGLESFEYYLNHTDRAIEKPAISEVVARETLSKKLTVKNVRLAIVPKGSNEELCYEFMCESNGITYYAYISAISKKQVELFEVQYGTEGVLLR